MKKIGRVVLLALLLVPALAFAAFGKVEVKKEAFSIVTEGDLLGPVGYWQITNSDTVPLEIQSVTVDWEKKGSIFGSGEVIFSDTFAAMYPPLLKPGETGYIQTFAGTYPEENAKEVGANKLSIIWQTSYGNSIYLPVKDAQAKDGTFLDGGYKTTSLEVTIENNTAETLFDYAVVAAAYNEKGTLLFSVPSAPTIDVGIPAGGQVTVRLLAEPGVVAAVGGVDKIASIEAIAYKIVE
ncbi:MAG: hypothetical protein LBU67_03355 [Oscillospiraceae bacterium]|jgi:hypothetical protein|nr:hypothetical protein [Oscillospiraceae bacterium]